jgi:pimeloyl-ACP methyl ester carboxylesterase
LTKDEQAGYHAVAPDLRDYGQTDQPENSATYSLLHLVGDLVGLLDVLGEPQALHISTPKARMTSFRSSRLR